MYVYNIYGKLNPALQVLEPCFTSPSLRFSINWYRHRPSKNMSISIVIGLFSGIGASLKIIPFPYNRLTLEIGLQIT